MKKKTRSGKRLMMLAAALALMAALSGLAVAANVMGLRDVLLPERYKVAVPDENGVVVPGQTELRDFVSFSSYQDTPESQALAEWQTFLDGYDQDGSIIAGIGNAPTGLEDRYGMYLVYTQEMADKLEEIVAKYGLKLHTAMEVVLPGQWPQAVGGEFLKENSKAWSGYIYENGTFRYDGEAWLEGYGVIEYQFSRSVRGTFDEVLLNIGDLTDFQEWGYQTQDGTKVTLGLGSQDRSLIVADLEDSFVVVNVLTGQGGDDTFSDGAIGGAELEALADSFNFSILSPVKVPDLDAIREEGERLLDMSEVQEEEPEDALYTKTGIHSDVAQNFVQLLVERLEDDRREEIADLFVYPAVVELDGERETVAAPEELLARYDETIGSDASGLAADLSWNLSPDGFFSDGSGLASAADGALWFGQVEEGVIRIFTLQTDQWSIRGEG